MRVYLGIFLRTAAALALVVLVGAQTLDFTSDQAISSATIVAWGLLGAVIAGVIAVGWAVVSSPALTPLGKAIREAVQALLATPIASLVIDSMDDVRSIGALVIPTITTVLLAFAAAYLRNLQPAPAAPADTKPVLSDVAGTTAAPA